MIENFFSDINNLGWLFGFIIAFIVLIVFFIFMDRFLKYRKKNKLSEIEDVMWSKKNEKNVATIAKMEASDEPKSIQTEASSVEAPKRLERAKPPTRKFRNTDFDF